MYSFNPIQPIGGMYSTFYDTSYHRDSTYQVPTAYSYNLATDYNTTFSTDQSTSHSTTWMSGGFSTSANTSHSTKYIGSRNTQYTTYGNVVATTHWSHYSKPTSGNVTYGANASKTRSTWHQVYGWNSGFKTTNWTSIYSSRYTKTYNYGVNGTLNFEVNNSNSDYTLVPVTYSKGSSMPSYWLDSRHTTHSNNCSQTILYYGQSIVYNVFSYFWPSSSSSGRAISNTHHPTFGTPYGGYIRRGSLRMQIGLLYYYSYSYEKYNGPKLNYYWNFRKGNSLPIYTSPTYQAYPRLNGTAGSSATHNYPYGQLSAGVSWGSNAISFTGPWNAKPKSSDSAAVLYAAGVNRAQFNLNSSGYTVTTNWTAYAPKSKSTYYNQLNYTLQTQYFNTTYNSYYTYNAWGNWNTHWQNYNINYSTPSWGTQYVTNVTSYPNTSYTTGFFTHYSTSDNTGYQSSYDTNLTTQYNTIDIQTQSTDYVTTIVSQVQTDHLTG